MARHHGPYSSRQPVLLLLQPLVTWNEDKVMHVLIAFLTALASVLYALDRLGVDIGWLNPWSWGRRRKWRKLYGGNPAFSIEKPLEAAALLITAAAKIDGDISLEEKSELLRIFQDDLKQNPSQSASLLGSSTFLLGSGNEVFQRPQDVLAPSLKKFSSEQRASLLELLRRIASVGGSPSEVQLRFISGIEALLSPKQGSDGW